MYVLNYTHHQSIYFSFGKLEHLSLPAEVTVHSFNTMNVIHICEKNRLLSLRSFHGIRLCTESNWVISTDITWYKLGATERAKKYHKEICQFFKNCLKL